MLSRDLLAGETDN